MEEGQEKVESRHYLFAGACLLVTVRKFLYLPTDSLTSDPNDQIDLRNGMEWLWNCCPMGVRRDGVEACTSSCLEKKLMVHFLCL